MQNIAVYFFFIAVVLGSTEGSSKTLSRMCDPHSIYNACGLNERCTPRENETYYCICQRNFVEISGKCVEISTTAAASVDLANRNINEEPASSGSSVAIGLLVPTFLIILGGVGFYCARRHRLLPCRQNLYGNVLVTRDEDDDDDPPIA